MDWVKRESKAIKGLFSKKTDAILTRLKDPSGNNSLYIFGEISKFSKLQPSQELQIKIDDPTYRDYDTKRFYDNLNDIKNQLEYVKTEYVNTTINSTDNDIDERIAKLYSSISGISELYKRLSENKTVTLKGIPASFKSKLQILLEELQRLNALIKIKTLYITEDDINIKIGEEDPIVVKILKENYSQFIDYIEKVKLLLYPIRESTNTLLQDAIIDFTENKKKEDKLVFEETMKKIKEELIFLKSKKHFNNPNNVKFMYTGVCSIDKNKLNAPHYEIYLGIDFFEGEINDKNLESIKCKYRGLYLGQETELFFSKYDPYDFYKHRVYVAENTKEGVNEKEEKEKEKPPISGGRKTRKNRRKSIKKTKKRF
jgi:hypothetical protein